MAHIGFQDLEIPFGPILLVSLWQGTCPRADSSASFLRTWRKRTSEVQLEV